MSTLRPDAHVASSREPRALLGLSPNEEGARVMMNQSVSIQKKDRGLYEKYRVERTDGKNETNSKHRRCEYFVLDVTHDPHARAALVEYAESCRHELPQLAIDLWKMIHRADKREREREAATESVVRVGGAGTR